MQKKIYDQGITYHIRLKGALRPSITDWLGEVTITPLENSETLLVARFPDQPALRGFLEQLWNLNFTILSVDQVENKINRRITL
jgi:hypothetical protein